MCRGVERPRPRPRPPLTILHVAAMPFPTGQGSQVYVQGLTEGLARLGHRVIVACFAHGVRRDPSGVEVVRAPAVPGGTRVRSGPHWSRPPQDVGLGWVVRRILQSTSVDVVHGHNVEGLAAAWVGRGRARTPLVYGQHTSIAQELPTYYRARWSRRTAAVAGEMADRVLVRAADLSVGLSEVGSRGMRRRGGRSVVCVPPGIDVGLLRGGDAGRARQRWSLGSRPWVLYTGNLDEYQDLEGWLEGMVGLPEAGALVLTGGDVESLARIVHRVGLSWDRVRLVRSSDLADLRDALAVSTLGIVPRRRCAGFPMKLLNHVAAGLPTVVRCPVDRSVPGIVRASSDEAMILAQRTLLRDPARRERLRAEALRHVEREWAWDGRARQMEEVYRRLGRGVIHDRSCGSGGSDARAS